MTISVEVINGDGDEAVKTAARMAELKLKLNETKIDKEGNKTVTDITADIDESGVWKRTVSPNVEQLNYTLFRPLNTEGFSFKTNKEVTFTEIESITLTNTKVEISDAYGDKVSDFDLLQLKGAQGDPGDKGDKGIPGRK